MKIDYLINHKKKNTRMFCIKELKKQLQQQLEHFF